MKTEDAFVKQAELVLQTLPLLAEHPSLALKGGTAINFFYRDLPRYSVDIDLCYTPLTERVGALSDINKIVLELKSAIDSKGMGLVTRTMIPQNLGTATALEIGSGDYRIILEINYVFRGTVTPTVQAVLSPGVHQLFGKSLTVKTLSFEDTFGGKLCATLSRQHPRDLFDVKLLLDNEGLTSDVKRSFMVYLAGSNRPFHEILSPNPIDLEARFVNDFIPMNRIPITLEALVETRERLVTTLHQALNDSDREFLLSMQYGKPQWSRIDLPQAAELPAIKWRLRNLESMDKKKRSAQTRELEKVLLSRGRALEL